jgi:hypothetical protein
MAGHSLPEVVGRQELVEGVRALREDPEAVLPLTPPESRAISSTRLPEVIPGIRDLFGCLTARYAGVLPDR